MKLKAHALTDIGLKRKVNQDAFHINDASRLFIVADGMGGHRGGEVASRIAVDVLNQFYSDNPEKNGRDVLEAGINASSKEIHRQAAEKEELAGMGTTVVSLLVQDDMAYIGQVGDSRAYLMHGQGIWQVTEDHSLMNEELRSGRLSPKDAESFQFKNVITRSVGYESQVSVDIYRRKLRPGDHYLLCTDGLSGCIEIHEIADQIRKHKAEKGLKKLVAMANARGGDDNITGVVIEVTE